MAFDPLELLKRRATEELPPAPLGGTRAERVQRLQIGLFGIFAMVLMIALADVVTDRVALTEAATVPEAAPTVEPSEAAVQRDPLVDAGVAPELPANAEATSSPAAREDGDVPPPSQTTPVH